MEKISCHKAQSERGNSRQERSTLNDHCDNSKQWLQTAKVIVYVWYFCISGDNSRS